MTKTTATTVSINGRTPQAKVFRAERVIQAARALATAGGYEAVQMREVAQNSHVALATLYRYFPSKDDLMSAAISSDLHLLVNDVRLRPPQQPTPEGRAGETFVRAFHAMVRDPGFAHAAMYVHNAPQRFGLHNAEWVGTDRTERDRASSFINIAAIAAWGVDEPRTPEEKRALRMLETLWAGSVILWLNGVISVDETEKRIRLGAKLLIPATPGYEAGDAL